MQARRVELTCHRGAIGSRRGIVVSAGSVFSSVGIPHFFLSQILKTATPARSKEHIHIIYILVYIIWISADVNGGAIV